MSLNNISNNVFPNTLSGLDSINLTNITINGQDISTLFVPYTNATANVNLGNKALTTNQLSVSTTFSTDASGNLSVGKYIYYDGSGNALQGKSMFADLSGNLYLGNTAFSPNPSGNLFLSSFGRIDPSGNLVLSQLTGNGYLYSDASGNTTIRNTVKVAPKTDALSYYLPMISDDISGNYDLNVDGTGLLSYIPSTGILTTNKLKITSVPSGTQSSLLAIDASGNIIQGTVSTNALTVTVDAKGNNQVYYPTFINNDISGNYTINTDISGNLNYNPSTGVLATKQIVIQSQTIGSTGYYFPAMIKQDIANYIFFTNNIPSQLYQTPAFAVDPASNTVILTNLRITSLSSTTLAVDANGNIISGGAGSISQAQTNTFSIYYPLMSSVNSAGTLSTAYSDASGNFFFNKLNNTLYSPNVSITTSLLAQNTQTNTLALTSIQTGTPIANGFLCLDASNQVIRSSGGASTITPQTANVNFYLVGSSSTSGTFTVAAIDSTNRFYWNPSTSKLHAPNLDLTGGITVNNGINISSTNSINFGYNVVKEANAGRIGYELFEAGYLCIVGAGTGSRGIKLWDYVNIADSLIIQNNLTFNTTAGIYLNTGINWYIGGAHKGYFDNGGNAATWRISAAGTASDLVLNASYNTSLQVGGAYKLQVLANSVGIQMGSMFNFSSAGTWDASNCLYVTAGGMGGTASGCGLGFSTTDDTGYLCSIAPNVAWKKMSYKAQYHSFLAEGNTEVFVIDAAHISCRRPIRTNATAGINNGIQFSLPGYGYYEYLGANIYTGADAYGLNTLNALMVGSWNGIGFPDLSSGGTVRIAMNTRGGDMAMGGILTCNRVITNGISAINDAGANWSPINTPGKNVNFIFARGWPGNYADGIVFNTWQDGSGGNANMVLFDKSGIGMRIYQQDSESPTSFYSGSYADAVLQNSSGNVGITNYLVVSGVGSSFGGPTREGVLNVKNPNGSDTHFGWPNNQNYIRGQTNIDDGIDTSRITFQNGYGLRTSANAVYGNVSTYGEGTNGYRGYDILDRWCFMSNGIDVGVHDNQRSWLWRSNLAGQTFYDRVDYRYNNLPQQTYKPNQVLIGQNGQQLQWGVIYSTWTYNQDGSNWANGLGLGAFYKASAISFVRLSGWVSKFSANSAVSTVLIRFYNTDNGTPHDYYQTSYINNVYQHMCFPIMVQADIPVGNYVTEIYGYNNTITDQNDFVSLLFEIVPS